MSSGNIKRLLGAANKPDFVAGAGSSQATAAAVSKNGAVVSGANGTVGVILPKVDPGVSVFIANPVNGALSVYPPSSQYINAGNQNAAFTQTALKNAIYTFCGTNSSGEDRWHAVLSA